MNTRRLAVTMGTTMVLLTMAMQAASAHHEFYEPYAELSNARAFTIEGAQRASISTTVRPDFPAEYTRTGVKMGLGPGEQSSLVKVAFYQGFVGTYGSSRQLYVKAVGEFTHVKGRHCSYNSDTNVLRCRWRRTNWRRDTPYVVSMVRGDTNDDNMTRWNLSVQRKSTDPVTVRRLSFRSRFRQLSEHANATFVRTTPLACEDFDHTYTEFSKPSVNGGAATTSWAEISTSGLKAWEEHGCDPSEVKFVNEIDENRNDRLTLNIQWYRE